MTTERQSERSSVHEQDSGQQAAVSARGEAFQVLGDVERVPHASPFGLGVVLVLGCLVCLLGVGLLVFQQVESRIKEDMWATEKRVADSLAKTLALGLVEDVLNKDYPTLEEKVTSMCAAHSFLRAARVRHSDGRLMVSVGERGVESHSSSAEIDEGHGVIATLELEFDEAHVDQAIEKRRRFGLLQMLGWVVFSAILIFFWIERLIGRPLRHLAGDVQGLVDSDLKQPVHSTGWGELRTLSDTIESMRAALIGARQLDHSRREQLQEALEEVHSSDQAKARFIASMSHEIRTPLVGVLGAASVLESENLNSDQLELLDTIRVSSEALMAQVNDILDYSKAAASMLELDNREIDPTEILEDVMAVLSGQAREKGLALVATVRRGTPAKVVGDAQRLRQIWLNLVGNAVKFTDSGGVCLTLRESKGTMRLEVRDTGPGFPEGCDPESLFEPFRQAQGQTPGSTRGSGLGLAICRELACRMGGEVGAELARQGGALFWMTLPAQGASVSPPQGLNQPVALNISDHLLRAAVATQLAAWKIKVSQSAELVLCGERDSAASDQGMRIEIPLVFSPRRLASALTPVSLVDPSGMNPSANRSTKGLRVLAADDNAVNRRVLSAMLRKLGCEVVMADDGDTAVELFEVECFDVVLLDYHMPTMEGPHVAQQLRALEAKAGATPASILAVSAAVGPKERAACREAGMDGFLAKPFRLQELETVLSALVPEAHLPSTESRTSSSV